MTDTENEPNDFYDDVEIVGDRLLLAFTSAARRTDGFSIGVTLTMPGGVVSGDLINPGRWLRELAAWEQVGDEMREFMEAIRDALTEEELDDSAPPSLIHLKNARIMSPVGGMPVQGMFWRGRIDQVAGWAMGSLSTA